MAHCKTEQDDWLLAHLKYLLFIFNFFFWVGGAAVMAVGIWTLVEKSVYLSILASSTFAASAYVLIFVGGLVMTTGFLGFGAIIREQKSCLSTYFCLLLAIFLVELVAGVLAHVYYQRLSDELKRHLHSTLTEHYGQPGAAEITASVDRLQQDVLPTPNKSFFPSSSVFLSRTVTCSNVVAVTAQPTGSTAYTSCLRKPSVAKCPTAAARQW
ncbi:tetraspanin-11 isoform X2 [Rattus norvegicus]|uniref:tetraspanin-11 isoform X2 n=1 Tax=Rattus norvegicus TaxID=10116 RepID=UPI0004E47D52|nr:tetraspanin-11 isoform X2 [Rattus norvegicus]|eukprot:XP_008761513.1 PREDICTED: tetraspanin-11 isoform X1 [Rattus norvegicus]